MPDKDEPMSEVESTEEESEQALLPRSFFAGKDLEIGSKCEVKVEGIYDDEVAVSYVPKKKDKDGKDKDKDKDSDDDDDKPKRRRERDDSDLMRESLSQMEMMPAPPPAMGAY